MKTLVLLPVLLTTSCAGVSFNQLKPDLSDKGAPEGAVYYLPKPVLLVSADPSSAGTAPVQVGTLPPPAAQVAPNGRNLGHVAPHAPPQVPGPAVGGATGWGVAPIGGADDAKDAASAATGPGSDQSYGVSVPGYALKVIYLPDLSRPMRLSVRAGLGTASLKPTLQNGWMLTGFDAQADSKAAEMLASVSQLVIAAKGPAGKAASAVGGGVLGADASETGVLRPGLYDFKYDDRGRLVGLCPLTYFSSQGPISPSTTPAGCR